MESVEIVVEREDVLARVGDDRGYVTRDALLYNRDAVF